MKFQLGNSQRLKHGHARRSGYADGNGQHSRTYRAWLSMKARCLYPKHKHYAFYGGAGITICPEWIEDFEKFLADMGERPSGTTIDRRNNKGNYTAGNCRWASNSEQARNRSVNRMLTVNGETLCVRDWERRLGLSRGAIHHRLRLGWSAEEAASAPRTRL